ncbi:efflux RND transporter permease subunit [Wenzhouxiangella sp. AB-CW3]|uniref:efflux RND transporter permease subunit n=1 Tax=Wenzhouxiangella sp. AB-CW3 TaxID=2771012 RepID=UPI00168B9A06|nr:CusA/CzcA family heavy metal efflux RND transporter [Wenzhouxiangella sp. AB-CW3]QOC23942.1 efflux RND transporter permease subunit [Wenzhouxiangella sp. AB-CW3]
MIDAIIRWSIVNRLLVLVLAISAGAAGLYAVSNTPVDAIPDLTDTQVIVRASFPGQAPQVVEDQVTYPLTTALMAVPGAHTVRGFSMFGDSFVYVLFDDDTDPYWARSRVLEYLSQVEGRLPDEVSAELGPDATGVGWVYKYNLVDRSGNHDLGELRALQDWFLKYELQSVPGVSEVATMGGMVRQFQVALDPNALRAYDLTLNELKTAVERGSGEAGGSLLELAEAEYMVRATGYIQTLDDLKSLPVGREDNGTPVLLRHVADIRRGPAPRRGIADMDGEGEVVGGIVVMRHGENAREVINAVKQRLEELKPGLPEGVEIVEAYDRSALIDRSIRTLWEKLALEFAIVVLVIGLFLWHLKSSLVLLISLPMGVLIAYTVMYLQGINANIMSLGGIIISIGVMVDAAIVLIENVHRHFERDPPRTMEERWHKVTEATLEVGRPIFFSLLIVALSFLPVFALEAQEGRLFSPLAFTKTYAMAAAAGLAVTLVPVLMGYFVGTRDSGLGTRKGRSSPVARWLEAGYRPLARFSGNHPWIVTALALVLVVSMLFPFSRLGTEFMPELDEGDLMYMPTTLPGLSPDKARELLQQTNAIIAQLPEVERVTGKVGRAETATDPAPLTMIETFITLKPRDQWRPGKTTDDLKAELDAMVQFPGLTNAWVFPIQTRIDMLQTGIRTDIGIEITGPDLGTIQEIAEEVEALVADLPGTTSSFADRPASGRYINIAPERAAAARHAMNIADVQDIVRFGIGGMNVIETVDGLERYPVNLRFHADWRDSPDKLRELPIVTPSGTHIALGEIATVEIDDGPAMIRSENTRPASFVFVDIDGRDLGGWVGEARQAIAEQVELPAGYSIGFAGQYEYLERARERLSVLIPLVVAIIVVLLMMVFRTFFEVALVLITIPLSLAGGFWLMWLLDFQMSVGVAVGFIALGGLAAETGVIMLVYLNNAMQRFREDIGERDFTRADLRDAIVEGACQRVRPITMTETTVFLGLLPVMFSTGTGAEVMQRIAAPMVGGVFTVWLVALLVMPALYYLWHRRGLPRTTDSDSE